MTYREANTADEHAIIDLLRLSLGEDSTEKSVSFWRWKHVDNPFGPSPVLVADDEGRIAGVRAFMRWEWATNGRVYRALRAVDTATHPDYRGRGVFKKLTLELIRRCKDEGDDFIFNTPNDQSRPGYLKMGWEELGKVPLRIAPIAPLRILRHLLAPGSGVSLPELDNSIGELPTTDMPDWVSDLGAAGRRWHTPLTAEFLRWRYTQCPVRKYATVFHPEEYFIVYYMRQQRVGPELRIVHQIVRPGSEGAAKAAIAGLARRLRPAVMTAAPTAGLPWTFLPPRALGLTLTFRALNFADAVPLDRWAYTLGDLELF